MFVLRMRKKESTDNVSTHDTEEEAWQAAADYLEKDCGLSLEELEPYTDYIEAAKHYGELTDYTEEIWVEELPQPKRARKSNRR